MPKIRRSGAVADERLRLSNTIREVGRDKIGLPHAGVQPLERLRILGWRGVPVGHGLVVGPQCDDETVTHKHARFDPRIEQSYGAIGFGEPTNDLDFELRASPALQMGDPSEDVTRTQTKSKPVRVVENEGIVDLQVKRRGNRDSRTHRPLNE